jgi:hypothetical protein
VAGQVAAKPVAAKDTPRSIGAVITSYLSSDAFRSLSEGSKSGFAAEWTKFGAITVTGHSLASQRIASKKSC